LITRRIARRNLEDDRGQAALIVLMLAVFFLLLLGLVSDGGLLLSQRRDLQGLADGAARAGAAAIDPSTVRTSHVPQIDPAVAQTQIDRYLAAAGFSGSAQVSPTPAQVRVELSGNLLARLRQAGRHRLRNPACNLDLRSHPERLGDRFDAPAPDMSETIQ